MWVEIQRADRIIKAFEFLIAEKVFSSFWI